MTKMTNKRKNKINNIYFWMVPVIFSVLMAGCNKLLIEPVGKPNAQKLRPQAVRIIQEGLSDAEPRIRAKAIEVVAVTEQRLLMPEVQKLLRDDYVPVRFAAALAVGDIEYKLAENSVKQLLKAPDENTRIAAAYAMYKLGHRNRLEDIHRSIKSKDQTIRANAVVLLGKSGEPNCLETLYWAKNNDNSDSKVRLQAAEAIAKLQDEKIFPKLWTMLISKYVDNKIIGIRAMGALGTPQAKEVLLTKLDDDILEVRLTAAEQLGMLGDTTGQTVILQVFDKNVAAGRDESDLERINVLTALAIGQIRTESVTKYLPLLMKKQSKLVRLAAAQAVLQTKL